MLKVYTVTKVTPSHIIKLRQIIFELGMFEVIHVKWFYGFYFLDCADLRV